MRLYLSVTVLTLAWFSVMNALGSVGAWAALEGVRRRAAGFGRAPRAQVLFAIRMVPPVVAAVFAFGLFLPAHWVAESREGTEYFGVTLYALAALAIFVVGHSALRTLGAMRAYRALRRSWSGSASGTVLEDESMPGMSLVGIIRTRVLLGRPVRESLSHDELDVALAHELAHQRSRDNVKRLAMFASPDFFAFTRAARRLDQLWNAAVECDADAAAVRGDATRAANLASALLKVARLAGASTRVPVSPLWSTFYQRALLELRVRRLVLGPSVPAQSRLLYAALLSVVTVSVYAAWLTGLPHEVHEISEMLVGLLP